MLIEFCKVSHVRYITYSANIFGFHFDRALDLYAETQRAKYPDAFEKIDCDRIRGDVQCLKNIILKK